MNKITVKNISSCTVKLVAPDNNWKRDLAPGRVVAISQDVYDELMYDNGTNVLLKGGFIQFDGDKEVIEQSAIVLEDAHVQLVDCAEIKELIKKRDISKFAKLIPTVPAAAKDAIIQYAVEERVTETAFVSLIKKYCGVDIIEAISNAHKAE